MPRPRNAIDYDDEIMKVEAQLIRCDKTKAELLERRQELLNAKPASLLKKNFNGIRLRFGLSSIS